MHIKWARAGEIKVTPVTASRARMSSLDQPHILQLRKAGLNHHLPGVLERKDSKLGGLLPGSNLRTLAVHSRHLSPSFPGKVGILWRGGGGGGGGWGWGAGGRV